MSQKPSRKRPFGVIAIIVLKIGNVLWLLGSIIILLRTDLATQLLSGWVGDEIATIVNSSNTTVMIALAFGLVILSWQLTVIFGLWFLKRWAWVVVMIELGLTLALCLWSYFQGVPLYGYMVLNTIMVFYLNQSEVQHAFGQKAKPRQEII